MTLAAELDPLTVRLLYTPHHPEPPQHAYLWLDQLEALYGGAAGGGKSDALLMGALQYVDVPGYAALLLRRTYPELLQADGLIPRAEEWLAGTDARWVDNQHTWFFPSGARLQFGYLASRYDRLRYQGGAYQYIGFDELTQFRQTDYRYLLSRLRRPEELDDNTPLARVPLRMRGATNPGGPGHEWVLGRFIEHEPDPDDPEDTVELARSRIFIPAKLEDNPHLDQAAYKRSLAGLPAAERAQLLNGDWYVDTGDRVYPTAGVQAAGTLGAELDAEAARGELGPPATPLALGLDPGEHFHGVLGYPLPMGGIYIVAGDELVGQRVEHSSTVMFGMADELPQWKGRRKLKDNLRLVSDIRYDPGSSGAQSIRTVAALARVRHPRMTTTAIAFNTYKRESIDYLAYLFENAALIVAGEADRADVAYIAISPRAAQTLRQCVYYRKDLNTGEPIKEDDHGPDALVALVAPTARKHRDRMERMRARAKAKAHAVKTRLPRP